jgi:HD-like signal output (HDOD) protein
MKEAGSPEPERGEARIIVKDLIQRMRYKGDFPAFSHHLARINEMTSPDSMTSADILARLILNDYALTNKLLKLVNSAYYRQLSGEVTSISQAVVILGFEQVRLAATSLMVFSHLNKRADNPTLQNLLLSSFLSAIMARDLAVRLRLGEREEAFLCGLFHNLGKCLVIYYFPEEYQQIEHLRTTDHVAEHTAAQRILGVSYDCLGTSVAEIWKFPESITSSMQSLPEGRVERAKSTVELLQHLAVFSNELCRIFAEPDESDREGLILAVVRDYEESLAVGESEVAGLLEASLDKLATYSDFLGMDMEESLFVQTCIGWLSGGDHLA